MGTSKKFLKVLAISIFQPPWDLETGKKFIIHYTYGCDYNMKGWSFFLFLPIHFVMKSSGCFLSIFEQYSACVLI